ncbi:peptidoglycan DD-metalloendopeptidase family protein [Ponticoccus sp. SC2-23]|uniref:murein hydrolase activator EnvC family protein n=1 Tax=Alexandriicola marinus TaxID=2081710 RepID=UPI000FDAD8F2|nr:peptidoglycan DD-metalloendopeptidase family protein [Alexandriicola marinus]MBM1220618.1 peptidoglycan DD-metalloendopeptidase family protein [Ponticoccus sp. SC6-9]MBM1225304.1 peptidoglycan DD-metalloendopeptidase family protein [Ponticoccus sp. SC6-15]MBM1228818.1 peptidoglycan DD-metalloendopeptidase family protein [Ponticoccus sp. SC6-38]MBM1233545.1 peptidoglycan DD-metalloendopeptidase family protein [Ponticoccus sp. SC6-45]MBM1239319.1 peptidoglycan DD-metalloendopeptidase family p
MRRLSLLLVFLSGPVWAQGDTAATAAAAAERLEAAAVLLNEAGSSRDRVAALTETVQAYEDGLVALRDGLRRAAIRERALRTELEARSEEVGELLAALQIMGRAPAPLLLLHPSGPLGTARSGMLVSEVTPAVQTRVDALRADLEEVTQLRDLQVSAAETLQEGLVGAQEARSQLANAIQNRTDLPRRFTEDPVATAVLIASTETLDAFASGLADVVDRELAGPVPDATDRKGTLPLPVQGEVIRRAGEADAAGIVRPGIVIAARPRSLVTTPAAATIRFRGPLLDYGNVIILEPAADVLFVIAGLAEVFGEAGQVIPEGAPLGLMGGSTPGVDAILTETLTTGAGSRSETLYLEVREGQSVPDPATWFAIQ